MLEVKPNKEILKIHTYWMGVTPFQAACMIMGLIAGSMVYYILPIPEFLKAPVVAPVVVLFCSLGFFSLDGMNLFQIIAAILKTWRMYRRPLVIRGRKEDINGTDNHNK